MSCSYAKFHRTATGMAMGVLTAIFMFLFGLLAIWGYGATYVELVGSIYIGYAATFVGAILGAIWGFVEGFIIGYLFAWLYNCMMCKYCKDSECKKHHNKTE